MERYLSSAWIRPLIAFLFKVMSRDDSRCSGGVVFVSSKLCIKSTPQTSLAEANAMEFVRQNPTIPVPRVYSAFGYKGHVYIVMQRIEGTIVARNWHLRTEKSRLKILSQLKSMVEQLRKLQCPDGAGVSNIDRGPIFDPRLPKQFYWGPFDEISDFHSALVDGLDLNVPSADAFPELQELASFYNQPWPQPIFTHGDLSSLNILCKEDSVVAILDWETAGWLPPYWEYVTAWNVNPQNSFWQEEVDKFLTPLLYARNMDAIRRKYFGFF
ncbi:uncharacterized protein MYCFIDRAFT_190636 [Pseudocercospora fijiensis CIRAD86]|uniref:Aminoglycoside phosphotransferase domain-containing protein n=1 Tax=Pseudocercospora fijiensis (strain CIRAD86) TaxID=383855 RepID=M3AMF8_PSEFD|nr:uncharacterized protein MYCFIDRAFT_190636 [Pseudocercospora fijiensis CIRAD86]EME78298.1 hypothetical protein MYCFIDRAFT_190636 [Pseudocercospora fijiensis CIRAD86]